MALTQKVRNSAYRTYSSFLFPPLVVIVAISCVTLWSWSSTRLALEREIASVTESRVRSTTNSLSRRFIDYESVLLGGAGLYRASDSVTRTEWQNYVTSFDLQNYRGVQGLGYVEIVSPERLDEFTAYTRETSDETFRIWPEGKYDTYIPVVFREPYDENGQSVIGFNIATDPVRLEAAERARDTGKTAVSGKATSLNKTENSQREPSFIMYEPVYTKDSPVETVEQRRQAIKGFVYASFRTDAFFESAGMSEQNDGTGYRVYAGPAKSSNLLYESPDYAKLQRKENAITQTHAFPIFGTNWTITYAFDNTTLTSSSERGTPFLVLVAGFSLATLIGFIILLLLRAHAHELSLEKEHEVALARDELLSLASHQLRTPATTVKQYLGMILQGFAGEVTPQQEQLLQKAYSGNERQLYVINEMLHLAKVDSGRIQLAKRQVDISALLRDIVSEQQQEAEAVGHELTLAIPKKTVRLTVDEHMLRMAIENVINNAIKYTPNGGRIDVKLTRSSTKIRIAVADNGVGIAKEDLPKLFKQFSRLPNERTELVDGTGVGLYLANHLIVLHGGSITATSHPGKGTTFVITLPIKFSAGSNKSAP